MMRFIFKNLFYICLLLLLSISSLKADENLLTSRAVNAIERGLSFLAKSQDKTTGAWLNDVGYKLNTTYRVTKENAPHVGITALACLALMADGNLPDRGRYGENVRQGLDFVLSCVHPHTGYISKHGTRMYSHAFATMFLAQMYGMTQDPLVKEKLQDAVDLIVKCQNNYGGWRYEPIALDADMSVTVCQVQALRSARNVGIKVSKSVIDRAIAYINRSSDSYTGGFKYQDLPINQSRVTFAVTAAGVTSLHSAGVYDSSRLKRSIHYLKYPPKYDPHPDPSHYFYYYGHYYASQAMYMVGGNEWTIWYTKVREQLIQAQSGNGNWEDQTGKNCPTAISIIVLQIPNCYLPIFQK